MNKQKEVYSVTVAHKHCVDSCYEDEHGCPLFKAIKEQLPDFPLGSVGGFNVRDESENLYLIDTKWDYSVIRRILDTEDPKKEQVVTFSRN